MEVKYVKSSPFLYLNRIHIATFLPFRAYNTDNQLIIDTFVKTRFVYGGGKFMFTYGIETILLPQQVDSIAESEFGYSQLSSITIPEHVTRIGSGAFCGAKLTSITIPEKVTYIGESALGGGDNLSLKTIYIHAKEPPTTNNKLPIGALGPQITFKIYVPKKSVETYKNAKVWKLYKDYIYPMP